MVPLYVWLKRIVHSYFFFGWTDRDEWDEHNFHIVNHHETWGLLTISCPHIFLPPKILYTPLPPSGLPSFSTRRSYPCKGTCLSSILSTTTSISALIVPTLAHPPRRLPRELPCCKPHACHWGTPPQWLCLPQAPQCFHANPRTLPLYLARTEELWCSQGTSPSARYVVRGGGRTRPRAGHPPP
jgi:hypothetical protein